MMLPTIVCLTFSLSDGLSPLPNVSMLVTPHCCSQGTGLVGVLVGEGVGVAVFS
jgi:hypothetical protein